MTAPRTIPALFHAAVLRGGDRTAIRYFQSGQPRTRTWREIAEDVLLWGAVLGRSGVGRGDRVAQVSANRYEWIVVDLAIATLGAVHVPIHATLSGAQVAYQIADCEPAAVIVENQQQAEQLHPHAGALPTDWRWIVHEPWDLMDQSPLGLASAADLAAGLQVASVETLAEEADTISPDDLATILYTSGTTGDPRGVMLTHDNVVSNTVGVSGCFRATQDDLFFNMLPLSHIYARTCDLYVWIHRGSELGLATSRETALAEIRQLRPTLLNAVPYFYDKLCKAMSAAGQRDTPGALAAALGGRIRQCFSGGAALPEHVERFFEKQKLLLLQGYGLTECSPVITASSQAAHKIGSVGQAIEQVEVKIAQDGEILTRGPHVMRGYWKNPAATAETIRDGWLHTGDLGHLDEDGFLFIRGRSKEILVTAAGKNIVPTYLEGLVAQSPLVAQVMIVGEGRNYLTALIVPDPDTLRAEILRRRIAVASPAQALVHGDVLALYRDELDRLLADVSRHEQVRRFTLLERGFSIEREELTAKLSLRREVILEHFSDTIERMYGGQPDSDSPEHL